MRFLFRIAFWLGVVLVLLPSGGSQQSSTTQVSAIEAMSAAGAAVGDMRRFCERQPETCAVGSQAAIVIGQRAQAGAKMLYEFLNEQFGPHETGTVTGGGRSKAVPLPAARPSQHTLTGPDLAPSWRGAQPHREAQGTGGAN